MKRIVTNLFILCTIILASYMILGDFPTGTVTIDTPVTVQNISGNFTLQVTIGGLVDDINASNVTFEFINDTGELIRIGVNETENLTVYTFEWDTTTAALTPGDGTNITVNATATFINQTNQTEDAASNFTTTIVENVTVDNTAPTVTLNEPTDNSITNATEIIFNFTVIDLIFNTIAQCNLTIDPGNSTGGSEINTTTNIANGTQTTFVNTVPTGGHTWTVACTDSFDTNNTGTSATFNFNGGTVAALISIELLDKNRKSATKFQATETVIFACTRSDEDGYNETIVSVSLPGISAPLILEKVIEPIAVNESRTHEVEFKDTKELGDYLALCEVRDVAGNTNATNISFTIEKKPPRSTSAFANKKFTKPVATVKISTGSTTDVGTLTEKGTSRLMQQGAAMKFTVKSEEHTVKIKELSEKAATLTIASTPFDVTVSAGETKNVDTDRDGKGDLRITFHKLFGKYADITLALLTEEEIEKEMQEKQTTTPEKTTPQPIKKASTGLLVALLAIIAIIILGYFLVRSRKR